jgi:hypothetical protein
MARFPTRTVVLMVLTLLSFVWFYWKMNTRGPAELKIIHVESLVRDGGGE